jgi:MerR family redox-sensitive transcriptional activator SoxR
MTIGELARRTGLSVSAIRFYEERGLIASDRTSGNQRRFMRSDIRRLSFAVIAQRLGMTISDIEVELRMLPHGRAPTPADWDSVAQRMRTRISRQIELLERVRDRLDGCIGCGCLSLSKCSLYNPDDQAGSSGPGPRFVLAE